MRAQLSNSIILFLIFLLFAGPVTGQTVRIKGKVMHSTEVLANATVSILEETLLTDNNGEFKVDLFPGIYTIVISYSGYERIEQLIKVESSGQNYFEFRMVPGSKLAEVVVVGSRSITKRSNLTSPVPTDVFSSVQLIETAQVSLTQMLNVTLPSLNASREILNEPMTLRGLDPDHVLILLDGIRYHNMAWLFAGGLKGQLGRGSVGNDLNSIPFPAIEKVEVLRDGAAAQYGSDAIAGVINIRLKESVGKTSIQLHSGQYYKGDGQKVSLGINKGVALSKNGFVNLSASYRYQAPTNRGGAYRGTVYYDLTGASIQQKDSLLSLDNQRVIDNGFNRQTAVDNTGNSKIISTGLLLNGSYRLKNQKKIFWTSSINDRELFRVQAYRFPKQKTIVNPFLFPNGFQPYSKTSSLDVSITTGIKATTKNHWYWDYATNFGINRSKSNLTNTNNPSQTYLLGSNAPTSFYTGKEIYQQMINNINFNKRFLKTSNRFNSFNLGVGEEWRIENYHTEKGEEASWFNYDTVHFNQGGVGAGGPQNVINKTRNVLGAYLEAEGDFNQHFLMNMAGRYEYYSDFGGRIAAKVAARYKFSESFLVRASVNNGFRAPSLQQRYYKSIQSLLTNSNGVRTVVNNGIFPNDDDVIKALNIPSLSAEKSINISGGFASSISNFVSLSVDAYWIQIKDRIVLSGTFERKTGNRLDSILSGYSEFNSISRISFFSNAINTRTTGVDIVLDANRQFNKGDLRIGIAANFNSTMVYGKIKASGKLSSNENAITLLNTEERTKIERGQPGSKMIMSVTYDVGKINLQVRNTRFGSTQIAPLSSNPARFIFESFSPKILTDISLRYSLKTWINITAGANNVFNIYPDKLKNYENTSEGSWVYSPEASPFGFNGGYYFISTNINL